MPAESYPHSHYAATANPAPERPPLEGEVSAEIAVLGAGYTGLSCALHLAERGHKVTVVEGARVGWGASGRNGGQIVAGLNAGLDKIGRLYGAEFERFAAPLMREGAEIIRERVARYGIACDLKDGNLFAATNPAQMKALEAKKALWAKHGIDAFDLLDRADVRTHVATDLYEGGMIDRAGGHFHPLNLALGEAAALEGLGGTIYEGSPVVAVDLSASKPVLQTKAARVTADTLVLAGNAYLAGTVPELGNRILPASTQVMATEPLGERGRALLPTDLCVEDLRYILDYYRLAADGALLFGGGTVYGGTTPRHIEAKLRPAMERLFPALKGVRVTHAWSGNFALTLNRVPQMGRLGQNAYFAHGYSGHGVTGSHLFGRILGEAIDGDLSRFDAFAKLRWSPFPGGRTFRVPYSVLGSWYYGLRDRMGI